MEEYTFEELEKMDLDKVVAVVSNQVYHASLIFERLENAGKIKGNGHHVAQKVAAFAEEMVKERWIEKKEK